MELESGADDRSTTSAVVRLMCSFGGKILPRPHDNQLRYVGGDTRIVAVPRSSSFSLLVSKLSKLLPSFSVSAAGSVPGSIAGAGDFTVKYQLPNEDLDALITVSSDEDVENMIEEFERLVVLSSTTRSSVPRLRLFLFPNNGEEEDSRSSSIASLLDGSRKRENWFLDALNGGVSGAGAVAGAAAGSGGDGGVGGLERGRSEASSIVSEVPDYLFGFDGSDDPVVVPANSKLMIRNRAGLAVGDVGAVGSDPSSPAFGSTSSAPPMMPNLPPVKTKPESPVDDQVSVGYTSGGPVWTHSPTPGSPYPGQGHAMQAIPVYYVPATSSGLGPGPGPGLGQVSRANTHIQAVPVQVPVPVPGPYIQHYGTVPGAGQGQVQVQIPIGYQGSGPMYGGGAVRAVGSMDRYEMQVQGNMAPGSGGPGAGQPMYYGVKNSGGMVATYPGMVMPVAPPGDEARGSGPDVRDRQ